MALDGLAQTEKLHLQMNKTHLNVHERVIDLEIHIAGVITGAESL